MQIITRKKELLSLCSSARKEILGERNCETPENSAKILMLSFAEGLLKRNKIHDAETLLSKFAKGFPDLESSQEIKNAVSRNEQKRRILDLLKK